MRHSIWHRGPHKIRVVVRPQISVVLNISFIGSFTNYFVSFFIIDCFGCALIDQLLSFFYILTYITSSISFHIEHFHSQCSITGRSSIFLTTLSTRLQIDFTLNLGLDFASISNGQSHFVISNSQLSK